MMKNIKLVLVWVLVLAAMLGTHRASAQVEVPGEIKAAIRSGSARDLTRFLNNTVEIGIDGDKSSYSKTQAEFVLKNFFTKNAPTGFDFNHQGGSDKGQRYATGTYTARNATYRVFVVVKQVNGVYLIDTIDFTRK
jgi:hypothetical protein